MHFKGHIIKKDFPGKGSTESPKIRKDLFANLTKPHWLRKCFAPTHMCATNVDEKKKLSAATAVFMHIFLNHKTTFCAVLKLCQNSKSEETSAHAASRYCSEEVRNSFYNQ